MTDPVTPRPAPNDSNAHLRQVEVHLQAALDGLEDYGRTKGVQLPYVHDLGRMLKTVRSWRR